MKRGLRLTLASICAVIITICCLALGLYTFEYMGFEDGKLRFYFGKNIDDPDNPSNPDTPNTPDEPDEPSNPDEPDDPISTKYTINLVFPDGKTEKYTYDPANEEFNANSYYTNWISTKEKSGDLYRFDNWYLDEFYHDLVDLKKLKDGDTLYAKMVAQVVITIHNIYPGSETKEIKRVDKNSIFKLEDNITSTEAELLGVYEDKNQIIAVTDFLASSSKDIYVYWSTKYSEFDWTTNEDGTITLSKFKGNSKSVIIPSIYIKYGTKIAVTGIGSSAFSYCQDLTSVIIPEGVTSIGQSAFNTCVGLTSIIIPDSVNSIGTDAFYGCRGLTTITPNRMMIEKNDYSNNNSLFSMYFSGSKYIKTVIIPEGVTSIGNYAFYGFYTFTTINIPNSVTSIGDHAFDNCRWLTSIEIPGSVRSIGKNAFYGCLHLTSVNIGEGVAYIMDYAFGNCTSLTNIRIPNSILSIGANVFFGSDKLQTVELGGIEYLGNDTNPYVYILNVKDRTKTEYNIRSQCKIIKGWAFRNCTNLISITVEATTPPTFGLNMFYNCSKLTAIYVPSGSVSAYKTASGWSDYADKIKAIP